MSTRRTPLLVSGLALSLVLALSLAACDAADSGADAAAEGALAAARANPTACANRNNNTVKKLTECVTLDGVRSHQAAFQAAADAHGGTRANGTPGFAASADYVAATLAAAGWDVQRLPFSYLSELAELQQLAPTTGTYVTDGFTGSGESEVTGPVTPVDLDFADPSSNTSGCEAADFAGLDFSGLNDIALIQRGACFFSVKAANAAAAGAEAVVIFNQGNTPSRTGIFSGSATTLPDGTATNFTIPITAATFADGMALAQAGSLARVRVDLLTVASENIIAEKGGRSADHVVMLGAHLDSVVEGPGINDNGSGSAVLLEIARQMQKVKPPPVLRFAWWGAEEEGPLGSLNYVNGLAPDELDAIALYIDAHMLGSPNFIRFVFDGDDAIEAFFADYFAGQGLPFEPTPTLGPGSALPTFASFGIPAGGLFTGADGIKTSEQVAVYGGTAGDQYDPCYHLACDTFDNVSLAVLDQNADAMAAAALTFAMDRTRLDGAWGPRPVSAGRAAAPRAALATE